LLINNNDVKARKAGLFLFQFSSNYKNMNNLIDNTNKSNAHRIEKRTINTLELDLLFADVNSHTNVTIKFEIINKGITNQNTKIIVPSLYTVGSL